MLLLCTCLGGTLGPKLNKEWHRQLCSVAWHGAGGCVGWGRAPPTRQL